MYWIYRRDIFNFLKRNESKIKLREILSNGFFMYEFENKGSSRKLNYLLEFIAKFE